MDALMSAVSEIKKKQNHLELTLEMQQVCQLTPMTEKPRQPPAHGHPEIVLHCPPNIFDWV